MLKKWRFIFLSVIVFLLSATVVTGCGKSDPVVMQAGSTAVTESEFLLVFQNEFRAEYLSLAQADGTGDPWDTIHEGRTLRQLALEATYDRILTYKAEQQIFAEYGICGSFYDEFLECYDKQRTEKAGSMYGKQEFSEYDYYIYLHSNYRLLAQQAIKEKRGDQGELYRYYQEHGEELRGMDSFVFESYSIPADISDGEKLLRQAADGSDVNSVVYRTAALNGQTAKYEQELVLALQGHEEEMSHPGAEIILENEARRILLRTVEYTPGQIPEFADCYSVVSMRFYEELYNQLVEKRLEEQTAEKTNAYHKIKLY